MRGYGITGRDSARGCQIFFAGVVDTLHDLTD
jgi:hypothetical protein